MGQCGCGDSGVERAYRLRPGVILGYRLYRGCRDCFAGPAVDITIWNSGRNMFLDGLKIEEGPKPDEYGGDGGMGLAFPLFEVEDIIAQLTEMQITRDIDKSGRTGYPTVEEWMEDYGLEMLQGALRRFQERMRKMKEDQESR